MWTFPYSQTLDTFSEKREATFNCILFNIIFLYFSGILTENSRWKVSVFRIKCHNQAVFRKFARYIYLPVLHSITLPRECIRTKVTLTISSFVTYRLLIFFLFWFSSWQFTNECRHFERQKHDDTMFIHFKLKDNE